MTEPGLDSRKVSLGVLLDEATARAQQDQDSQRLKARGNVNEDLDRASEADERKRRLNLPCNTAGYSAPPTVSHSSKAVDDGGGKDVIAEGLDLSYGASLVAFSIVPSPPLYPTL